MTNMPRALLLLVSTLSLVLLACYSQPAPQPTPDVLATVKEYLASQPTPTLQPEPIERTLPEHEHPLPSHKHGDTPEHSHPFPPHPPDPFLDTISRLQAGTSVVHITAPSDGGKGTGFVINNDGGIITAAHSVVGNETVCVGIRWEECTGQSKGVVVAIDNRVGYDMAYVKLPSGYGLTPLKWASEVRIGENILTVGTPRDYEDIGVYTRGSVVLVVGGATFGTDAISWKGFSGAPVLNRDGDVVGMHVGRYKPSPGKIENMAVGITHSRIRAFLDDIGISYLGD